VFECTAAFLKKSGTKKLRRKLRFLCWCADSRILRAGRPSACLACKTNDILKIESSLSFSKSHSFYGLHIVQPRKFRKPEK
jgi:hypothetical protein